MNENWQSSLSQIEWANFETDGDDPGNIVSLFHRLAIVSSHDEAEDVASRIWSMAVTQNEILGIAVPIASIALAMLESAESDYVKYGCVEILSIISSDDEPFDNPRCNAT